LLFRDIDKRENIELMLQEVAGWYSALSNINRERLKAKVLKDVADGDRDLELLEVMDLFPSYLNSKEKYAVAADWMKRLSLETGVQMRRVQQKATTMFEIKVLTHKLCRLEEEGCGLAVQLREATKAADMLAGDFQALPLPLFLDPI